MVIDNDVYDVLDGQCTCSKMLAFILDLDADKLFDRFSLARTTQCLAFLIK